MIITRHIRNKLPHASYHKFDKNTICYHLHYHKKLLFSMWPRPGLCLTPIWSHGQHFVQNACNIPNIRQHLMCHCHSLVFLFSSNTAHCRTAISGHTAQHLDHVSAHQARRCQVNAFISHAPPASSENVCQDMGVTDDWINLAMIPLLKNGGKWFNMVDMLKWCYHLHWVGRVNNDDIT